MCGVTPDEIRRLARVAAALYLISALPAASAVFIELRVIARDDPAATATNIMGSETLFRTGIALDLVGIMIFLAAVAMLYQVFKLVNANLSLLAAFFSVIGCAIQAVDSLGNLAALVFLKGGTGLPALSNAQSQDLAYASLRLYSAAYVLALGFFGASVIVFGYLVFTSTLVPRILGALWIFGGVGYLTFSLATVVSPPFAAQLSPFLPFGTAVVGEGPVFVWLLVKGVSVSSPNAADR